MYSLIFIVGVLFMMVGLFIKTLGQEEVKSDQPNYREVESINKLTYQLSKFERDRDTIDFKVDTEKALEDMPLDRETRIELDEGVGRSKGEILLLEKLKEDYPD